MSDSKSYLGDGAYIEQDGFGGGVVVTTEDGISVQNRVVLGPGEIVALVRYLRRIGIDLEAIK